MAALLGVVIPIHSIQAQVLEEVIVTAQKREQTLQEVGISVTALSGDQLRDLGYLNAQEVTAMAPGVSTIQPNGPSNYAIAIRGVAQNDFVSNQESPVSLYVDEVYISQMSGAGFLLFDMERVEILRGPQGTLFGRNATGGLAHYITRKPSDTLDGYMSLTYGDNDQINFEGAVGGAITDGIAGRLSFATRNHDGYIENRVLGKDINNADDIAVRGQLLFDLSEKGSLLLNGRYYDQDIRTGFFENVSSVTDASGLGVYDPTGFNFNGYRDNDGDVYAGDYDRFGGQEMEVWGATATLTWDFDNFTLTSITDYQDIFRDYFEDSDASPIADFNFYLVTDAQQFSQEVRFNGETERTRWVGGVYYLDIDIEDANGAETPLAGLLGDEALIDENGNYFGNDNPYQVDTESFSVFGQIEYDFTPQLTGIVGVRWISEKKSEDYAMNFVLFDPASKLRNGNPNIIDINPDNDTESIGTFSGSLDDDLWSAKLQLDWRPNDDLLVYASYNRGVKGAGFNAPLDITDGGFVEVIDNLDEEMVFKEETLNAYEVGFKATLMNGLARLNGAVYYYDYEDFQAFKIIGLSTFIFNADAENKGFELELQTTPVAGLDVLLGVGYVDADIQDADLGIGLGPQDTKPVQSPKWNLNGLVRYEWPALGGKLALQADAQYRSKHHFSLTRAEASTENGYTVANARVAYRSGDDRWELAAHVSNFTDEEYLVQTFDLAGVLGMTEQYYGMPRWWGFTASYQFGN
jgi:iron complex outermembrane receptor protein